MSSPTHTQLDVLHELPDSGKLVLGDRITLTKRYAGLYTLCRASALSKGTIGTGDTAGFIVRESTATPTRSQQAELTIIWEAGPGGGDEGFTLPADTFSVTPENLAPRTERHPLFASLDREQRDLIRKWLAATDEDEQLDYESQMDPLAEQLLDKLNEGRESYYLAGLRYVWTTNYWELPDMSAGGFIESPGGPLAGYFTGDNQWLREADTLSMSGGIYSLTRSWIGGTAGTWDEELQSASYA